MSVKEEFENFYKKLQQINSFDNIDDRLKFETLITQASILHEVIQNPTNEHLSKIKTWIDEHTQQLEYFVNKCS